MKRGFYVQKGVVEKTLLRLCVRHPALRSDEKGFVSIEGSDTCNISQPQRFVTSSSNKRHNSSRLWTSFSSSSCYYVVLGDVSKGGVTHDCSPYLFAMFNFLSVRNIFEPPIHPFLSLSTPPLWYSHLMPIELSMRKIHQEQPLGPCLRCMPPHCESRVPPIQQGTTHHTYL